MKVDTEVAWGSHAWVTDPVMADAVSRPAADIERDILDSSGSETCSLSGSLCAVRTLALCQALVFLALILFICTLASATTGSQRLFNPELTRSVYVTEGVRDPFGSGVTAAGVKLDGEKIRAAVPSSLDRSRRTNFFLCARYLMRNGVA